jgi:tRNA (guanine37-N1)-methyltransferase
VRIDVVSIFPDYFQSAGLSLLGRARAAGLIRLDVHDLRDWTRDRHRTVDDTPYGGGAGMVMSPRPWGEALDAVLAAGELGLAPDDVAGPDGTPGVVLIVPTPSGELFDQPTASRLARATRLVFACGRYEGIDARVARHYRDRAGLEVAELSIGDYVLAGGEVAALVMIEAITRLIPGVLGNAESLAEESHTQAGLLEGPVYTKPPVWRGLEVPPVLLSGDHGRIAAWRQAQAESRTRVMRPGLAAQREN